MFVKFENYDTIELHDIKENIDFIKKNSINVIALANNGMVTGIDSDYIDHLFDTEWMTVNEIIKDASYYILKNDKKNIFSIDDYNDGSFEKEFFDFFSSCKSNLDEVRVAQGNIIKTTIGTSKEDVLDLIKEYYLSLKKMTKNPTFDKKYIKEISNIITHISFMGRMALVTYTKVSDKNTLYKSASNYVAPLNIKTLVDEVIFVVFDLIGKLGQRNRLFDSNIYFLDTNVIAHTNRVFLMFSEFLYFYNDEFNFKGLASRTRVDFKNKFAPYYSRIMEKFNPKRSLIRAMEVVSKLGMRSLTKSEMHLFSLGALWHDIVKVYNIDYFPQTDLSEIEKSQAHVLNGYYLLRHSNDNNPEVNYIIGYHHEYFGFGYGLFSKRYKEALLSNPNIDLEYIITYNYRDVEKMEAISYFPAKVLEIVDIYDFLKYDTKVKARTASQALTYMRTEMIEKNIMLDPVLFNLFTKYIKEKRGEDIGNSEI